MTNNGLAPGYMGAVPDLGSGAHQSPGGNAICENGQSAVFHRSPVALFARNNTWGSAQAAAIVLGGPPPPAPFPECGLDPDGGDCDSYAHCA